jgi:hypothetical protein
MNIVILVASSSKEIHTQLMKSIRKKCVWFKQNLSWELGTFLKGRPQTRTCCAIATAL